MSQLKVWVWYGRHLQGEEPLGRHRRDDRSVGGGQNLPSFFPLVTDFNWGRNSGPRTTGSGSSFPLSPKGRYPGIVKLQAFRFVSSRSVCLFVSLALSRSMKRSKQRERNGSGIRPAGISLTRPEETEMVQSGTESGHVPTRTYCNQKQCIWGDIAGADAGAGGIQANRCSSFTHVRPLLDAQG
jgi:hypothetical protein